ncbi:MAG: SDR family NAD(P)-dependent oxidoreductase [Propionibacterium sp.]|uniref:SDR family NAD(P)-dependent oxidoreductase n=1 Tax=Propionibacterium freudenreichii TaxID=1744 RepID=UPI00054446D5|nr:SDR family NAD(P)-dependent oxidoreductase [Propionibacterium freudenreichii]MDN6799594.1 SDR family NAD(P)-dependent oxidoreductase [Propionibacterium sp.]MCT2992047.1 SDR family NAD(P)-dependent oxidoreductase [Propionibacterium freudenreichii]MCT2992583.1 SDR family NAD(P)-dependent oxidoreductase [Propionibacterium freudenreichii]MDK9651239.1 SDR family NAD(P)-dependent oxidoreductase [Propionibacterium freudenreichii]MDK9664164.1 SDR family NAD(P)-dependent oxidoreductase [Propionibact
MNGRVVVVTGGSGGVGAAAARELAERGDQVVVVGRNARRTQLVANEIGAQHFLVDYADLNDVRRLADDLRNNLDHIDVLANNAGGIIPHRELSLDGNEMTLQVNHLAPFLLTNLLIDKLEESHASVIGTSSVAHRAARLNMRDLQLKKGWSAWRAYANSKLMNVLFTRELHHRYSLKGISSACFHPGIVASSFAHDLPGPMGLFYRSRIGHRMMVSPEHAARTLVFLAQGRPPRDWISGMYYNDSEPVRPSRKARNRKLADQLWTVSAQMVGLVD